MRLEKGDAFGELALLYDSVRSATIVTDETTELIILDKESFRKHIRVSCFKRAFLIIFRLFQPHT